jgi:hypothetical protein
MKHNVNELLRKAQAPVLVATVLMPLTFLGFGIFTPDSMAMTWLLPAVFLALGEISLFIPGKLRLLYGILSAVLMAAVTVLVAVTAGSAWLSLLAIFFAPALLMLMPVAGWSWNVELSAVVCYVGIGTYVGVQTIAVLIQDAFPGLPDRIGNHITVAFLVFALLTLLLMNRIALNSASVQRHKASLNVRRKNRAMVLGFFLLVTFLVATPTILDAVWSAILWIIARIRDLMELLRKDEVPGEIPPTTIAPEPGQMGDLGGKDTLFAKIMRSIFHAVTALLQIAVIPLLILLLVKLMPKLMRKLNQLMASFHRFADAASEDYDEEITDIRDRDITKRLKIRTERWMRPAEERRLTPDQRVRYRYRRLLKKHPDWTADRTARENLPEDPAGIYERARYSRDAVTEEEAKQFLSDIKKV